MTQTAEQIATILDREDEVDLIESWLRVNHDYAGADADSSIEELAASYVADASAALEYEVRRMAGVPTGDADDFSDEPF